MTRDTRSSPPVQPTCSAGRGEYHLLVIGIDEYIHFNPLKTAVNDAKALRDVLTLHYGFAKSCVTELWNEAATAENIDRAFRAYGEKGEKSLGEADSLLIYFAGHGSVDSFSEMGAWAPVDARKDTLHGSILNETIKAYLARLAARHVLVISDSCFSGDFFKHREAPQSIGKNDAYMQQALAKNSRQALTSGGLEPVSDDGFDGHSVFAYYLLKTLRENTAPYLFPADLHDRVKGGVSQNAKQTPRLGHLFGARSEEGGEFVLFRDDISAPVIPPPIKPRLSPASPAGTIWISENDSTRGPFTKDEIQGMITQAQVHATTLCWTVGMDEWLEIGKMPEWKGHWPDTGIPPSGTPQPIHKSSEKVRLSCPYCNATYEFEASILPDEDIKLECSACKHQWFGGKLASGSIQFSPAGTPAPVFEEKRLQLEAQIKTGDPDALYQLGCLYLEGVSGRKSPSKAARYFKRAAKKNHTGSMYKLGEMFEQKNPCTQANLRKAFAYYDSAKKQGLPVAKMAIGRMCLAGVKLRKSFEALRPDAKPSIYAGYGLDLLKIAAKENCAEAELELGFCNATGRFSTRLPERALEHFQRAADLGAPLALKILGNLAEMQKAKAEWHARIDRLQSAAEEA